MAKIEDAQQGTTIEFVKGQAKKVGVSLELDDQEKIAIKIVSSGVNDDLNQIALLLAFTLEKLMEQQENTN